MKKKKIKLPKVTLVAISSVHLYETVRALLYSMREIEFAKCVLISHKKPVYLPSSITFMQTDRLRSVDDYSFFCVYRLADYIDTEYALIVHHDGFVVNPAAWRDSFLQYDYIGSPWPLPKDAMRYRDAKGGIVRVGNGVSLRSRRLLEYPKKIGLPWEKTDTGDYNEDCFLCCKHRLMLEENGFRFAPLEEAAVFGREHPLPENEGIEPFLFHQWRGENKKYPHFINLFEKIGIRCRRYLGFFLKKAGYELTDEKWEALLQFVRYLLVGAYNMALSYLVYVLFLTFGFHYLICNLISFCFSVLNSFICSQKFVFCGKNKWYIMLGKVAASYVGTGLILQEILSFIWVEGMGVSPFWAPFLNALVVVPLNFVIQKFWAYR